MRKRSGKSKINVTGSFLERVYKKYNHRKFVHPDPLEFLYNYPDVRDREIAGMIASHLAYGRVAQILKSVHKVLQKMGESPRKYLERETGESIRKNFKGFKHRFTTERDISNLLIGIKGVVKKYDSMEICFRKGGLRLLTSEINQGGESPLPIPERKSACKRLNLFLRWMIRKDAVDPGGWKGIPKSKLIIPLDTHMHKVGLQLGFTKRKSADLQTALEITSAFARSCPEDPVKYDFALTRPGIWGNPSTKDFF